MVVGCHCVRFGKVKIKIVLFDNVLFWNSNGCAKNQWSIWTLVCDWLSFVHNPQLWHHSSSKKKSPVRGSKILGAMDCLELLFNLIIFSHFDEWRWLFSNEGSSFIHFGGFSKSNDWLVIWEALQKAYFCNSKVF